MIDFVRDAVVEAAGGIVKEGGAGVAVLLGERAELTDHRRRVKGWGITLLKMAGYSATPLWKKLGYAAGTRALAPNAPAGYANLLTLPADVKVSWLKRAEPGMRFVHLFTKSAADLSARLVEWRRVIAPDGVVWVSWPKKASGVATDITEDTIRKVALPLGYVDIKVCAVDETWSGLKLMIRKTER